MTRNFSTTLKIENILLELIMALGQTGKFANCAGVFQSPLRGRIAPKLRGETLVCIKI